MRTSTTLLYILLLLFPFFTWGQTHTWNGNGGDTNWFNASNWDANTVPDATSTVLIPSGFTVDITSSLATLDFMTIEANATLEVNNSITITNGIEIMANGYFLYTLGTLSGNATITNHGTFEITGWTQKIISQLTFNNENLLFINDTGIIRAWDNMVLNNAQGATILASGSSGALSTDATGGTFNNYGLLHKEDIGQFGSFYLTLVTNNYGTLWVGKTQNILVLGPQQAINNMSTGIMAGEGSFDITAPFSNNGIIRPDGTQAVELDFVNTFTLSPQSTIELDIFGSLPEEYDTLEVLDDPYIEGAIAITLHYDAAINDTFTVITASHGITGCNLPPSIFTTYQNLIYEFEVTCTSDEVILKVINKEPVLDNEEFEQLNITATPNPTRGTFDIQFGMIVPEVELTVSNVLGQTLSKHTVQNTDTYQLTIDGATGIYFITAKTATEKTASFKVIKK
ncbi:MAG: T9SS type A sorting domain-containing protein [Flavobacteriaceae bacterium]